MTDYAVNNIDQYGDGYMEPEEEWEREGLLDPAWEKQQKKTPFSLILKHSSPQASSTDQAATAVSDDRVNICGVMCSAQRALRPIRGLLGSINRNSDASPHYYIMCYMNSLHVSELYWSRPRGREL
uniref:Uncharacterized protein n=1 Tax=Timema genevievae TaxID=629358 RepID=A0A7R9JN75_TIMGE|nr:unnamed protein product [Timema genevievae]